MIITNFYDLLNVLEFDDHKVATCYEFMKMLILRVILFCCFLENVYTLSVSYLVMLLQMCERWSEFVGKRVKLVTHKYLTFF